MTGERVHGTYECYGFRVECAADPQAAAAVAGFFGPAAAGGPTTARDTPTVRIDVGVTDDAGPVLEPPFFPDDWERSEVIQIDVGSSWARVGPARWTAAVSLARKDLDDQIVWGRWIFERIFLYLICRSERHYPFHAGAVTVAGQTALVTADSGVGKSTFSAWALRRGAAFSGDDLIIRHLADPPGVCWGYPRATYMGPALLARWPELAGAAVTPVPRRDKSRVLLPESLASRLRSRCEPACFLFLRRGEHAPRELSVEEAVERTREDFATAKLDPAVEARVAEDVARQLADMRIHEFAISPDLEANHRALVALLQTTTRGVPA
jgi:hypothetical protein